MPGAGFVYLGPTRQARLDSGAGSPHPFFMSPAPSDPRAPFPAHWTVRRARDAYLAENGFTVAAYDDPWTEISFLGIGMKIPNTTNHKRAIRFHDLHHVATGFGTDLVGEWEISAFEVRRGLSHVGLYVALIVLGLTTMGFVAAPVRTLRAFRGGKKATPLWAMNVDYDQLLDMTVGELRALLTVPPEGLAQAPRRLHDKAPRSPTGDEAPRSPAGDETPRSPARAVG